MRSSAVASESELVQSRQVAREHRWRAVRRAESALVELHQNGVGPS